MSHTIEIRTLHTTAGDCGEDKVCPSVHAVPDRPGLLYVVSKRCTPAETAAFAGELEDGEVAGWGLPDGFLPADTDALTRARAVRGDALHPGRAYVISSRVTDPDDLAAFGHLFDAATEQLGTVLVPDRELQEA